MRRRQCEYDFRVRRGLECLEVATETTLHIEINSYDVCTDFEILKVNVPIIFLATRGFSLHRDGRYNAPEASVRVDMKVCHV